MSTSRLTVSGSIGGAPMAATITRTAAGAIALDPSLAIAKVGQLTTRGSTTAGTLTMATGHGITTAALIDIYWTGGRRYDVLVGTVASLSVPFTGGAGDDLPANLTAVTAAVQEIIDVDVDCDLLVMIGALCSVRAHIGFFITTVNHLSVDLPAGECWFWSDEGTAVNPLAGHVITQMKATQSGVTAAKTLNVGLLYNSDAG